MLILIFITFLIVDIGLHMQIQELRSDLNELADALEELENK